MKYRIVKEIINNVPVYYPEFKFFWIWWRFSDSYLGRKFFLDLESAEKFINKQIEEKKNRFRSYKKVIKEYN